MQNSVDHISEQLFKVIKGYKHQLVLFTEEGKKTVDPAEARGFYAKDIQMMVNFVSDETTNEITVNLSPTTDIKSVSGMLASIRTLASRNIIEYTVKTFGKDIEPKDFAYQAMKNQNTTSLGEGFSGWTGSARKSISELDDARIVIRHKRSVDETKRGARSRQIESIFIENADGERFKFPSNNLTAARAMTRHIKEGGTPYDDFGQHIYETMSELNELKKFQRYNKKRDFFENADITEEIGTRVTNLRSSLKQMSGVKGYPTHLESFTLENKDAVSQERLDELQNDVTVRYFDEAISSSLPYVAKIIESYNTRHTNQGAIVEFAKHIMKNESITVSKLMDATDPDSPCNRTFEDAVTEIAEWISHMAPTLTDSVLAGQMTQIAENISGVDEQHLTMLEAALNVIIQNASVVEADTTTTQIVPIDEEEISNITESFDKYNVRKIFGV